MSENTRLIVKCLTIALLTAVIIVHYARACFCDACPNRYAIWRRGERQLCRECKNIENAQARRFRRRRALPWRIWRRTA